MFRSKRFSKKQGFLRSVRKAPPYPSEMLHGQNRATDHLNKAELFNQFFNNVFSWKAKKTHQQFPKNIHNIAPCERDQISPILQKLDISKSKGLDGIGNLERPFQPYCYRNIDSQIKPASLDL